MKTILISTLLSLSLLLSACSTGAGLLTKTPSSVVQATNTVWQTNVQVQSVTITNGVTNTVWQTNVVATPVIVQQTNYTYTVSPTVQTALSTGENLAPLAPAPYGWILSGVLALAGAALGAVAKAKTDKASMLQTIVTATVAGVEAGGDAATKQAIQSHANAAGVQPILNDIVQAVTAHAPAPAQPKV